jgi:hypothetical protein
MVNLLQVHTQEGIGPTWGTIAELPRVVVDDRRQQRVNDPAGRRWATGTGRIREAVGQVPPLTLLEALGPVVDRAAADAQKVGDAF